MQWMENRADERGDVAKYYPKAKSVISLGLNYFTGNASLHPDVGKISNYAWGDDYHDLIKSRLYNLLSEIKSKYPKINGIACVDTSPIMEKDWAQKAGLGWIGKHTNLITRDYGSWIFLGELLLDVELEYDMPFDDDLCGTCTACLDACPTNAFPEPYVLDSNKCISYLTIEHRGDLPTELENKLSGWIYGCDICQEVCPWNITFSQISNENSFLPRENIQERRMPQWEKLTEQDFRTLFKKSAVKRTKYSGLKRNISLLEKNGSNNPN
jgi:epoxyqueuosine reductase